MRKYLTEKGCHRYDIVYTSSQLDLRMRHVPICAFHDPRKPLSDSKIMKILNDEGINIARRTVAKYRDELNIPSSTDRKQIF